MLFFQILFSMIWIYYIYMIYFGIMYWSNVASENWEFYPRSPSRLKKQAYFSYQLLHNKKTKLRGLKQWFIICCNSLRGWLGGFSTGLTWDHSCSFIQLVVSGDSWVSLSICSFTQVWYLKAFFQDSERDWMVQVLPLEVNVLCHISFGQNKSQKQPIQRIGNIISTSWWEDWA